MSPFFDFSCDVCGCVDTLQLTVSQVSESGVPESLDQPCVKCECERGHTRQWHAPALGQVQGAGWSPSRTSQ